MIGRVGSSLRWTATWARYTAQPIFFLPFIFHFFSPVLALAFCTGVIGINSILLCNGFSVGYIYVIIIKTFLTKYMSSSAMSLGPFTRNPLTPKTKCKNAKIIKRCGNICLELHVVIILGAIVVPIRPFFGHLLSSGLFA